MLLIICSRRVRRTLERLQNEVQARRRDLQTKETQFRDARELSLKSEHKISGQVRLAKLREDLSEQNKAIEVEMQVGPRYLSPVYSPLDH